MNFELFDTNSSPGFSFHNCIHTNFEHQYIDYLIVVADDSEFILIKRKFEK